MRERSEIAEYVKFFIFRRLYKLLNFIMNGNNKYENY